jgi:autophagy-related protein 5
VKTLGLVLKELAPQLFSSSERPNANVVIHGVSPSLETPILWLSENCSNPDNFLYIVVT